MAGLLRSARNDRGRNLIKLALAVAIAGAAWWQFGWRGGVLWFVFLVFLLYDWDDRVVGTAALVSLTSCPVLIALGRQEGAETTAVWAFFFLVITVALQIVELKRHPERFKE